MGRIKKQLCRMQLCVLCLVPGKGVRAAADVGLLAPTTGNLKSMWGPATEQGSVAHTIAEFRSRMPQRKHAHQEVILISHIRDQSGKGSAWPVLAMRFVDTVVCHGIYLSASNLPSPRKCVGFRRAVPEGSKVGSEHLEDVQALDSSGRGASVTIICNGPSNT